ncbi:Valine N-monooxygenase 2, partial [Linum grandiflorum]
SNFLPFLRGLDLDGQGNVIKEANKTIGDLQNPIIDERIRQWQSGERKLVEDLTDVFITLMAELINQPELLAKATTEIDQLVGKECLLQESDIGKLNYVKACARESFRLHPLSVFNVPHIATEDTVVADHFIPKGSSALLSRYGLGRNPNVWSDPLKFDPK